MITPPLDAREMKQVQSNHMLRNALRKFIQDNARNCAKRGGVNVSEFVNLKTVVHIFQHLPLFPDLADYQKEMGLTFWGSGVRIAAVTDGYVNRSFEAVRQSMQSSPTARYLAMDIMSREEFALFLLNEQLNEAEMQEGGWVSY